MPGNVEPMPAAVAGAPRRARAAALVREMKVDGLVLGDPGSVAWLTGHAAPIDTGPSPFAIGPFAFVDADGTVILFVSEDDSVPDGVEVCRYAGYTLGPLDRLAAARRATAAFIEGRRLAIEAGALPAGLVAGARSWVDAERSVLTARAVKDPDEIERLRVAITLCDAGQAAVRQAVAPGVTELELWTAARAAIDTAAGSPTPVIADLVTGPRTVGIGGAPRNRRVSEGDLVLCDLVPRHGGLWGDSCATLAVREPSVWARGAHRRCRDALDAAIEAVRPGLTAGDLDQLVRAKLPGLPHHVGHGIGASSHEEPRIVPGNPTPLEAGMVLAIEPGEYGDQEGVRVERVVVVVDGGCELLSGHDLSL